MTAALVARDPEQVAVAVRALEGECQGDKPSAWVHRKVGRASDEHSTVRTWRLICWVGSHVNNCPIAHPHWETPYIWLPASL